MLELRHFQIFSFAVLMLVQVTVARVISSADYPSYQAAVDAALPGDAVKFVGGDTDRKKDKNVRVSKTLRDVQFFDMRGNWDLGADVDGCLFFSYSGAMKQTSGRLRKSIFFQPSYGSTFNLTHSDSVMFYYCETLVPMSNAPRISLVGFVRGVTIHKMVLRGETGTDPLVDWKVSFAPAVEIDATDPVGNGWGTYIISPIVWQQRAWTPFHIIRGSGITFAHVNTEYNRWADPIMDIDHGTDCVMLCTGVGAAGALESTNNYKIAPVTMQYPDHEELGHPSDNLPFKGAAFRVGGQRNKVVAQGDYKTWSLGLKMWLPCLHYDDGTVARDPFFQQWPCKRGGLTLNLSEPKNIFAMGLGYTDKGFGLVSTNFKSPYRFPPGANLIRPVLLKIPPLRVTPGGSAKATATLNSSQMSEVYSALATGATVHLGAGRYTFDRSLTSGEIAGAGMGKTVLEFGRSVRAAGTGAFRGFSNCTVRGGQYGYYATGMVIQAQFIGTRFEGCTGAGIYIAGNSQNDCIQDVEFVNCKVGIAHGNKSEGNPGDPNIDKLDILNCTFRSITEDAIRLSPSPVPNGQVAVHYCLFEDIGESVILIKGGQTHLIQNCTIKRAAKSSDVAIINVRSGNGGGAVAVSHITIDNSTVPGNDTGIIIEGVGATSHCSIKGPKVSLYVKSLYPHVVDNVQADGTFEYPGGTYVATSQFSNFSCPGVKVNRLSTTEWVDVTAQAGVQPLDATPPPAVGEVTVARNANNNTVSWTAVTDDESGINAYAIYASGKEVGRTFAIFPVSDTLSPTSRPYVPVTFLDRTTANTNYTVRAINGANLLSGGGMAPVLRWTAPQANFYDKSGALLNIKQVLYDGTKATVIDANGLRLAETDLMNGNLPREIVYYPGSVSGLTSSAIANYPKRLLNRDLRIDIGSRTITLSRDAILSVKLIDCRGRTVANPYEGFAKAGKITFSSSRQRYAPGLYYVTVTAEGMGSVVGTMIRRNIRW